MDTKFIIFIVFVFIAAFFILEALYYLWAARLSAESTRLKRRIANISSHDLDRNAYQGILKNRYTEQSSSFSQFLLNLPLANKLDKLLVQSGELWTIKKFFRMSGLCALTAFIFCFIAKLDFVIMSIIALLALFLPLFYLIRARNKRFKKFEDQLPEAIDSICRSLKAGHAFNSAFGLVGEEFADPIATEFRITMEENNLGVNINDAMANMAKRVPLTDLGFFVIAVTIQRETGGNLAEILGNISQVIRERFKLFRHIRVLSAEGRMSARVLILLPFIMMFFLSVSNPDYSRLLFHTPNGHFLLKIASVFMIIAILWMRNIMKVRV
jgi:tight adherence protein B